MNRPEQKHVYLEYITLEQDHGLRLLWFCQFPFLLGGSERFSKIRQNIIEHIIGGER